MILEVVVEHLDGHNEPEPLHSCLGTRAVNIAVVNAVIPFEVAINKMTLKN